MEVKSSQACKVPASVYDSYMSMKTYPLALPADLLKEVRRKAKETGLSMADAMRLALREQGLPQVRRGHDHGRMIFRVNRGHLGKTGSGSHHPV